MKSYWHSQHIVVLEEDEAIHLTFQAIQFKILEFSYTLAERGSSVKAPVAEDIEILHLSFLPFDKRDWTRETRRTTIGRVERSSGFHKALQDFRHLQKELSDDI